MTLTATTAQTKTDAELLALLNAMTNGQQNIMRQGYNAYSKRQLCFWVKYPATKADVQSLTPEYITEVAPNQYKLTDLGVKLYQAWLNQPLARPGADKQPQGYHGTRHSRNWVVRDLWEQKLPSSGQPAAPESAKPEAVEIPDTPAAATEPVHESVPVPPTPPQPPTPTVVQLDLTAFIQPLLAEIEALKAQLAAVAKPAPKPVVRRTARAAMPMAVLV